MLPCNVIVQDFGGGQIEVAAIDPTAAMAQVGNAALSGIVRGVRDKLDRVVQAV
jgi:hypothetical protein